MNKTLNIRVFPDGKTEISTHGFAGASCQQATAELERALGQRVHEQLTADFYQQSAPTGIQQHEG